MGDFFLICPAWLSGPVHALLQVPTQDGLVDAVCVAAGRVLVPLPPSLGHLPARPSIVIQSGVAGTCVRLRLGGGVPSGVDGSRAQSVGAAGATLVPKRRRGVGLPV